MRGLVSVLSFAACLATPALASAQEPALASAQEPAATATTEQSDPWEGFNRNLFALHEGVDEAVVEPVARGYRAVTPGVFRQGVRNVLRNLRGPVIFANDVLQGEFNRAGTTAGRFVINSTVGVVGVFDPATPMGLERHDEDFGQTLAVWGVDSGPYIFIPLMGPSTVRDTFGRVVDAAFDPLNWIDGDEVDDVRIARTVFTALSAREQVLETVDDIRRDSLDPYVTIRTSYGLLRESAIQNGPADVQDLPDFEDIDDEPALEDSAGGENPQH
ncbi:MAG: VacJ family lipoprotein [Alphaproteobacteria bacterium]|nr:MAG: VacJ family lipoprotein [Alphaproteobacteria bacterium]